MKIPEYEALMAPALHALAQEASGLDFTELHDAVAHLVGLEGSASGELLPSGRGTVFANRLRWALTYLTSSGQVELTASETYAISAVGHDALEISASDLSTSSDHLSSRGLRVHESPSPGFSDVARPPPLQAMRSEDLCGTGEGRDLETKIKHFFEIDYQQQKARLIERVHAQSPEFFENLIVDLLLAMGYGRRREDLAARLGKSGDGGVDGVLLEDELGLNRIYFQAKRYKPSVSVPISAVRDFAGSLESMKANRGLFLTTAKFPVSAEAFVATISKRIVLVDGNHLASLMMRHRVGVKLRAVYELKCIDEGYFAHQQSY